MSDAVVKVGSWSQVTLYTHGNTVQYKVGGEHYLSPGGGVEYVPVSAYDGLLVEGYPTSSQPWPAHNLLPIDDGFDPGQYPFRSASGPHYLCN